MFTSRTNNHIIAPHTGADKGSEVPNAGDLRPPWLVARRA